MHGGPGTRASVRLRYLPGELLVDIDDGAGAVGLSTTSSAAGVGGGLLGMRERARAYGGDVQAGPRTADRHPDRRRRRPRVGPNWQGGMDSPACS